MESALIGSVLILVGVLVASGVFSAVASEFKQSRAMALARVYATRIAAASFFLLVVIVSAGFVISGIAIMSA